MANTIKIKRGLSSNISNITLAQGELAITTDTNELYVGTANGNVKLNDFKGKWLVLFSHPGDFTPVTRLFKPL